MSTVDLNQMGAPIPVEWQVQQVQVTDRSGEASMFVKVLLATPQGVTIVFLDGDSAERLASNIKKAGKHAKAGIWSPTGVGVSAPQRPIGGERAPGQSSPSTSRSGGQ